MAGEFDIFAGDPEGEAAALEAKRDREFSGGAMSEAGEPVPEAPVQQPARRPSIDRRTERSQRQPEYTGEETADKNALLPLAEGLMLGWSDEALAGVLAAYGTFMPELAGGLPDRDDMPMQDQLSENYRGIRDTIRESQDVYARENPKTAMAAEMAGGLATGGTGLARAGAGQLAKGVAKRGFKPDLDTIRRLAQSAGVGGAEGAIYGAGTAEEMEDVPREAGRGALWGMGGGMVGGEAIHQGRRYFQKQSAIKDAIEKDLMKGGTPDTALMKLEKDLRGTPKIADDARAIEASAQGWGKGVINAVKSANPLERVKFKQMNRLAKKIIDDPEGFERTWDVVGDSFITRFNILRNVNRKAGKDLEKASKQLKNKTVDYRPAVSQFQKDLEDMGIELWQVPDPTSKTGAKVVAKFENSDIEGITAAENVINNVVARMNKGDNLTAYDLHRMKKFIDEHVSWGVSGEGLKGKTINVLKDLRKNLDEILDTNFPLYDKANTEYMKTIRAMDEIQKVAGKQVDLASENGAAFIGQEARALLSNRQKRVRLYDAMKQLDNVAEDFGGKQYDSIMKLTIYADELDSMFEEVRRRTSIAGEMDKVAKTASKGGAKEALQDVVIEKGADLLEGAQGINKANAWKAIEELIEDK